MSQVKKEPHEWGRLKGHWHAPSGKLSDHSGFWNPEYAMADNIYAWSRHAYHYSSKPILLTEKQFEQAMEAAKGYPVTPPYGPAVSRIRKGK